MFHSKTNAGYLSFRAVILAAAFTVFTFRGEVYGAVSCADGKRLRDYDSKHIVLLGDALIFHTNNIELDIDGSPEAYDINDEGLEDICNGLAPLSPPQCHGKINGDCYAACQNAFRRWDKKPEHLQQVMCSVGLGGSGCSAPRVRLQSEPHQERFVSETSVHPAPAGGVPVSVWIQTQPGQLDSIVVPYFVIGGGFRHAPWDATPGDLGIVIDQNTSRQAAFIIGDTGGGLKEGSARLLAELRGVSSLSKVAEHNAFGIKVQRLRGAMKGDFRVVVFRHSAPLLPRNQGGQYLVLDQTRRCASGLDK